MEDHNPFEDLNAHNFNQVSECDLFTLKDQEMCNDLELDLKPAKMALMSDIFDCIVGRESAELASLENSQNSPTSHNLKAHIRKLAIERRREIARNILKTESGMKVVNAIKTRIAYYRVSKPFLLLSTGQTQLLLRHFSILNSLQSLWIRILSSLSEILGSCQTIRFAQNHLIGISFSVNDYTYLWVFRVAT